MKIYSEFPNQNPKYDWLYVSAKFNNLYKYKKNRIYFNFNNFKSYNMCDIKTLYFKHFNSKKYIFF